MRIKNNNTIIRKANKYLILNTIRRKRKLTIDNIQTLSKLSYPTVNKIVNELLNSKVIMKDGFADSNGGKPPAYLSLNTKEYFALGIDVEVPTIRFQISNLYGEAIYKHKTIVEGEINKEIILEEILNGIEHCGNNSNKSINNLIGIGIGLPGTLDLLKNISVEIERIEGWHNIDLIKIIQDKYDVPVHIRNDVHLMAWVESSFDEVRNESFAVVAIRQGVGMAICFEGNVYEGLYGNAGFLGHTTAILDGIQCKCGKKGCLEAYISKEAIEKKYQTSKGVKEKLKFSELIERAKIGDESAEKILKNAGKLLGIAIANNIEILDINNFIISGLSSKKNDIFFESVKNTVKENVIFASTEKIKITKSIYDNEAYALGGCYFVIEQFFKKPNLMLQVSS
jgi:N-acetylglucosamine repressor